MSALNLQNRLVRRLSGFGSTEFGDSYVFEPETHHEIKEVLEIASRTCRNVVLRGAGRSYGDAAILSESVAIDLRRMRSLDIHVEEGTVAAEAGASIEDIWKCALPHGFWPPVVSGTMFPTVGGALAMNIHGKNAFQVGTLGEHVDWIDVMSTTGQIHRLTPQDADFFKIVSGSGLIAIILQAQIRLKKVTSGNLIVTAKACRDWEDHFQHLEAAAHNEDYCVSWVDMFASGKPAGRGLFHSARYADQGGPESLLASYQELPSKILGIIPKDEVWRFLKLLNTRPGMKLVNGFRSASAWRAHGKSHLQSLVAFSFLLDYVPNWQRSYDPGGFIQYQCFVPKLTAKKTFETIGSMARDAKLESFLAVLKRHRPDPFLFSHGVDGFSLAQDFKVTLANKVRLLELCHRMNDVVLEAGGRFYFAKDSTLRPSDVQTYLGAEALEQFRIAKQKFDPGHLLDSQLARRVELTS